MAIRLSTGEVISPLECVTTIKEVTEQFPVSRGAVVMWMYKDKFEWVQIGKTIIINRDSFVDFWNESHYCLDQTDTSK